MKKTMRKWLAMLLCAVLICGAFTGCGGKKAKDADWDMAADSLMNFPWGCSVERAEVLLGVSEENLFDTMGDSTAAGRNNVFYVYELSEDYPITVDYLQLTYQNYVDADGKETVIGVTDLIFGYSDRQEVDGAFVDVEMTEEQKAYIKSCYEEQVSRCKDRYTTQVEQYGKTFDVEAYGDWSKEKVSDLGYLAEYFEEYDFDTYQNQYPLVMGQYTDSQLVFSGTIRAYLDAGLPKTDNTKE